MERNSLLPLSCGACHSALTLNASYQLFPRSGGYATGRPCRRVLPVSRCPGRELFILSSVQTPTSRRAEPSPGRTVPPGLTEIKRGSFVFKREAFKCSELTSIAHLSVENKRSLPRGRSAEGGSTFWKPRAAPGDEIRARTWEECRGAASYRTKGICRVQACIGFGTAAAAGEPGAVSACGSAESRGFPTRTTRHSSRTGTVPFLWTTQVLKSTVLNGNVFLTIYHSSLCGGNCSVCSPDAPKYHFAAGFLFAKVKIITLIPSSRVKGFFPLALLSVLPMSWGEGSLK